jgi:hypothetical protein
VRRRRRTNGPGCLGEGPGAGVREDDRCRCRPAALREGDACERRRLGLALRISITPNSGIRYDVRGVVEAVRGSHPRWVRCMLRRYEVPGLGVVLVGGRRGRACS